MAHQGEAGFLAGRDVGQLGFLEVARDPKGAGVDQGHGPVARLDVSARAPSRPDDFAFAIFMCLFYATPYSAFGFEDRVAVGVPARAVSLIHTSTISAVVPVKEWSADLQKANDALSTEIDERQRAQEALRASDQRLQDTFDNSTAVVSVKDLELRYVFVNRAYERRFHVQRDQVRGKTDFEIYPQDVAETVQANDQQVIETGTPAQSHVIIPMADGERHYVVVKFLLRDCTGKPYAVCGIATDVTELRPAEELQARRARQAALRADVHAAFSAGI